MIRQKSATISSPAKRVTCLALLLFLASQLVCSERVSAEEAAAAVGTVNMDFGQAAEIIEMTGPVKITHRKGTSEAAKLGTWIMEGDSVETSTQAKLVARLQDASEDKDRSKILLTENSKITFDVVRAEGTENLRDVKIELFNGRLRALVLKTSDPILPTFRVFTPTAKITTRAADFVVRLLPERSGQEKTASSEDTWTTLVSVLDGRVKLGVERNVDGKTDSVDIDAHNQASFISPALADGSSLTTIQQSINHGEFTLAHLIEVAEAKLLEIETSFAAVEKIANVKISQIKAVKKSQAKAKAKAAKAKVASSLCAAPAGNFNQCSWQCSGHNPKAAKSCRTDLSGVTCLRRICRASGQWAEETRLPASQGDLCDPKVIQVHECGAYW
jgi:hypothetical protein